MNRLTVVEGSIVAITADVIVNAANEWMLGGGGVDGVIHAAAGAKLLEACRAVPEVRPGIRCPPGEARITPAFDLPARFVIHTVGPRWRGGTNGEPAVLASCYRQSLRLASEHGASSIVFPAISTGAFAYPAQLAARIAARECGNFLDQHPEFESVVLVAIRREDAAVLRQAIAAEHTSRSTR